MIDRPVTKRIRRGKAILDRVLIDRDLGDVSYADVVPSTPGRDNYRVALFFEGDKPADGACTCPDFRTEFQGLGEPLFNGPRGQFRICKHMVAVGYKVVERRHMNDREPRKKSLKQALLEHGIRATTDGTRTLQRMLDTAQRASFHGDVPASGLSPKEALTMGEGPDGVPHPEQLFGSETVYVVSGINHLPVGSHEYAGKFSRRFDQGTAEERLAAAKRWATAMFSGQIASGVPTAAKLAATIKISVA